MELPTASQVRELLDAADREFRAFIALCAFAGLRLGEAAALQVGDVDLPGRRLAVRRQVQRKNAGEVAPTSGRLLRTARARPQLRCSSTSSDLLTNR
jgi:integrase